MREGLLRIGLILLAQTLYLLQTAQKIHSTRSEAESESDSLFLRRSRGCSCQLLNVSRTFWVNITTRCPRSSAVTCCHGAAAFPGR